MKTVTTQIKVLIEDLESQYRRAKMLTGQLSFALAFLHEHCKKRRKWRSVSYVKLKLGQLYITRHVYRHWRPRTTSLAPKTYGEPHICRWEQSGWRDLHWHRQVSAGHIGLQVWI